jgi:hypothetical protein
MATQLRACVRDYNWDVPYLARLAAAASLAEPLTSARRSVSRLFTKLRERLVCAVADEDRDAQGDGARLQRGRVSARLQRGHGEGARLQRGRGALPEHLAHAGVAFADGSGAASTKTDIDDLRDAEEKMRLTRSAALQGGAGALSRDMKAVRLLLREFADALELLEKTWAGSSGRQSRRTWTKAFLAEFKESDKNRNALFQRLDALRRHIDRFQSARIQLA